MKIDNSRGLGDGESPGTDNPYHPSQQGGISCLFFRGRTHALGKATQKRHAANTMKKEGSLFLAALFIRSGLSPNHWVDADMNRVKEENHSLYTHTHPSPEITCYLSLQMNSGIDQSIVAHIRPIPTSCSPELQPTDSAKAMKERIVCVGPRRNHWAGKAHEIR